MKKTLSGRKVTRIAAKSHAEDSKKEAKIKGLIELLTGAGLMIRRERLKAGHGWKTISGACRLSDSRVLFLDRKLPLDEQILILSGAARQLGLIKGEADDTALIQPRSAA